MNVAFQKQSKEAASDAKSDEYAVDKIISKRYNPRKKTFEYLVKWENFDKYENSSPEKNRV